jgi:hypothetical protein
MVAVIKFSTSLRNVLNYNENKLKHDTGLKDEKGNLIKKAEFIHSSGFAKDTDNLGFTDKFKRLQKQMSLSETRKKSVAHISLNFDPSEKARLDKDKELLKRIADTYMQKIGFANQPYLVYKHTDAGHPHIHIVTTIIQDNGIPIETNYIGKLVSEPARKEIEKLFGLVEADKHRQREVIKVPPVNLQKVNYGKSETKRAITNVLDYVLPNYKYTTLAELNAVLKQYNILADTGGEKSRIQQNKGLVYRVLDENGNKIGVPIKASDIYSKPVLKVLEKNFQKNDTLRTPFKQRVKNAVDLAFVKRPPASIDELQRTLKRDRISLVARQNADGIIYGLTYIDHQNKCVFNGSDLGKQYSAKAIVDRLLVEQIQQQEIAQLIHTDKSQNTRPTQATDKMPHPDKLPTSEQTLTGQHGVFEKLIQQESASDTIPFQLKQKKKRKRKRLKL